MRIVALLALRNEALYLRACLDHLAAQGIETCVIDNGSSDESRAIAESHKGRSVFEIVDKPYQGFFDWTGILQLKERLATTIAADWFIHHDADEFREAPPPWRTLAEGIQAMDRAGWNAINFDEFVFVPTQEFPSYERADFVSAMHYYYFYQSRPNRRINAWKKGAVPVNLVASGGHRVSFPGRRIAPDSFVLRHYIFLSLDHCIRKYTQRPYSKLEIEQFGWHRARARLTSANVRLPALAEMKRVQAGYWDKSEPCSVHRFMVRGSAG